MRTWIRRIVEESISYGIGPSLLKIATSVEAKDQQIADLRDRVRLLNEQVNRSIGLLSSAREEVQYLRATNQWLRAIYEVASTERGQLLQHLTSIPWPIPRAIAGEPLSEPGAPVRAMFGGDTGDILDAAREVRARRHTEASESYPGVASIFEDVGDQAAKDMGFGPTVPIGGIVRSGPPDPTGVTR